MKKYIVVVLLFVLVSACSSQNEPSGFYDILINEISEEMEHKQARNDGMLTNVDAAYMINHAVVKPYWVKAQDVRERTEYLAGLLNIDSDVDSIQMSVKEYVAWYNDTLLRNEQYMKNNYVKVDKQLDVFFKTTILLKEEKELVLIKTRSDILDLEYEALVVLYLSQKRERN